MSQTQPKTMTLTPAQMNGFRERVSSCSLNPEDRGTVLDLMDFNIWLQFELEESKLSIHRLKACFGLSNQKKRKNKRTQESPVSADNGSETEESGEAEAKEESPHTTDSSKVKPKGHGHIGEKDYTGAETQFIAHPCLKHGDHCPNEHCSGRVYLLKTPGTALRIEGNAIASATRYVYDRLQCNLCKEVFSAKLPEGIPQGKSYDESLLAMLAISRYFLATPFYRLELAQKMMGIPLPDSTQFDKMEELVEYCYAPFMALVKYAAQGEVIYNDDTKARILSLMKENETLGKHDRKGIFTTGIVAKVGSRHVYLYFTGRNHAGENLTKVLSFRDSALGPIIQMADASTSSLPKHIVTILCLCLAHGLRKFSDIDHKYPEQCEKVLKDLEKVYKNDAFTKKERMSPQQRLEYHQEHSAPVMKTLKTWLDDQIEQKLVLPNSSLGEAIQYLIKHWSGLTRFLTVASAPLDNNICEAALKLMIRIRKNSMFFKSEFGALVGSVLVSLIYTAALSNENPKEYLIALQQYPQQVSQSPQDWLPWNYREPLCLLENAAA